MKKKTGKNVVKILVILIVTILSVYYVLKDDPIRTFSFLGEVHFFPFLLALALACLTPVLDGIVLTFFTRLYNRRYRFSQGLVNTIIGSFIGCIYKTGAMFIQAYTFTKQDVKGAHAASILTMQFLMYQITFTLYSLIMVFVGYPFVRDIPIELLGGLKIFPLSLIGLSISLLILVLILALAFFKPLHRFFMGTGIDFLSKIHLVKKPDESRKKWTLQFATYRIELKRLGKNLPLVVMALLFNALKLTILLSLPYLIFWSIGIDTPSLSFPALFSGASYLQLITSFVVVGAPEIGFQTVFSYLLSLSAIADSYNVAAAANLLWRIMTFYIPLIVGGLFYFFYKGAPKKYELLSNTATIYDLEVLNLLETNDRKTMEFINGSKKEHDSLPKSPLLTKRDVQESFAKIRRNMEKESTYHPSEEDLDKTMTLELQKKQLAKAVAEAEELRKMFRPDPEVEEEFNRALDENLRHQKRQEAKRRLRKAKKMARQAERDKRFLEKRHPKGTRITYDEKRGMAIDGPIIEEERTYTTSDESEKDDVLEGGKDENRNLH